MPPAAGPAPQGGDLPRHGARSQAAGATLPEGGPCLFPKERRADARASARCSLHPNRTPITKNAMVSSRKYTTSFQTYFTQRS